MKPPSRSIQVPWTACIVEGEQLKPQLGGVLWLDSRLRTGSEEAFQSAMPEAFDHLRKV